MKIKFFNKISFKKFFANKKKILLYFLYVITIVGAFYCGMKYQESLTVTTNKNVKTTISVTPKPQVRTVSGKIVTVGESSIKIKDNKNIEMEFSFDKNLEIMRYKNTELKLTDFTVDKKVILYYKALDDGKKMATRIRMAE